MQPFPLCVEDSRGNEQTYSNIDLHIVHTLTLETFQLLEAFSLYGFYQLVCRVFTTASF